MTADEPSSRTWSHGTGGDLPDDLTGVRWPDGAVECRFRLLHPAGSLVAPDGAVGLVLTARGVDCTTCSDACAS
jgi:hypothetical protein